MTNPYSHGDAPSVASGWAVVRQTWARKALWINVGVVTLPSAVFLVANAAGGLYPAIGAAAVAALVGVAFRLARRERIQGALIGLILVAACAIAAAATGEARGFFLVPTLVPFVVLGICLITVIIRRPLTGLLLNRLSGGPALWYLDPRLTRIHYLATAAATGINIVNASLQVLFYSRNDTAVLALAHAATGPVFAALVAVTVVAQRRALATRR
jgi:uncharacterized protein DUF3159